MSFLERVMGEAKTDDRGGSVNPRYTSSHDPDQGWSYRPTSKGGNRLMTKSRTTAKKQRHVGLPDQQGNPTTAQTRDRERKSAKRLKKRGFHGRVDPENRSGILDYAPTQREVADKARRGVKV
jgi:hypothetical protein